jgi:hypothetical protein
MVTPIKQESRRSLTMADDDPTAWFHSNRYSEQVACEHCAGIIRHESWCITANPVVYYAYEVVAEPSKLTVGDGLILHSLGVTWVGKTCQGNCVIA